MDWRKNTTLVAGIVVVAALTVVFMRVETNMVGGPADLVAAQAVAPPAADSETAVGPDDSGAPDSRDGDDRVTLVADGGARAPSDPGGDRAPVADGRRAWSPPVVRGDRRIRGSDTRPRGTRGVIRRGAESAPVTDLSADGPAEATDDSAIPDDALALDDAGGPDDPHDPDDDAPGPAPLKPKTLRPQATSGGAGRVTAAGAVGNRHVALRPNWTGNEHLAKCTLCSREAYPYSYRRRRPVDDPQRRGEPVIPTVGEQRVAVLIAYSAFTERPAPRLKRRLRGEIFDESNPRSFASFWRSVSFGKMWLRGDVHGPYDTGSARFSFDFVREAIQAADRLGDIDWDEVDRLYVLVPQGNGRASRFLPMAAFGDSWEPAVELPNGRKITAAVTLIDERSMGVPVPAERGMYSGGGRHEFAHTLGLGHQGTLRCGDAAYQPDDCAITTNGVTIGGISMGRGRTPTGLELETLGWTTPDRTFRIDRPGAYIVPLGALSSPGGVHIVKIPRDAYGGYYTLEFRRPIGPFEPDLWAHPWSPFGGPVVDLDGVFFAIEGVPHPGHGLLSSITLDLSPGIDPYDVHNTCLKPGEEFVCPVFGTTVRLRSIDGERAVLQIDAHRIPEPIEIVMAEEEAAAWDAYLELLADPDASLEALADALEALLAGG